MGWEGWGGGREVGERGIGLSLFESWTLDDILFSVFYMA